MPRPTIEYMNARRAAKAASGGTSYGSDRLRSAATEQAWADTERERLAGLDPIESLMEQVRDVFADFRDWQRNMLPLDVVMEYARDQRNQAPF